jgi:hypothetical protein
MPMTIPASEMEIHSIDATLAIGSARLSRGIGVSNNPGTPTANTTAANGFFGVLVEDQLPNITGAIKAIQLPCCNRGLVEVLIGAAAVAVVRGAPLTLDANNAFIVATAGQKVYARAQKAALPNTFVLALIHNEGTL